MNFRIAFACAITSLILPVLPVLAQTNIQAATPKRCDFVVTLLSDETFDFNLTTLKSDARKKLTRISWINWRPAPI